MRLPLAKLHSALDNPTLETSLAILDHWLKIRFCDPAFPALFGRTRSELVGESIGDLTHDDGQLQNWLQILNGLKGNDEVALPLSPSQAREFTMRAVGLADSKGGLTGIALVGQKHDLREKGLSTEVESQLTSGSHRFGFWEFNVETQTFRQTPTASALIGLEAKPYVSEARNDSVDHVFEDDRPKVRAAQSASLEHMRPFKVDFRPLRAPDRIVRAEGEPIADKAGRVVRVIGTLEDVTKQYVAERILNETTARDLGTGLIGFFVFDEQGYIVKTDETFARWLDYKAADLLGRKWTDLIPAEQRAQAWKNVVEGNFTGRLAFEREFLTRPGAPFWGKITSARSLRDGKIFGVVCVQDVTAAKAVRRRLEEKEAELAHLARIQTLDSLVASITHELAQPLTAMTALAAAAGLELAKMGLPDDAPLKTMCSNLGQQAERMREIIARLKRLTARSAPQIASIDVNRAIEDVLPLVRAEIDGRSIVFETEFEVGLPSVDCDVIQIQQVMLNLFRNAMDACESGCMIRVKTAKKEDLVEVSVIDDGKGLGDVDPDKLFTPFYSTKPTGAGIGLSVSRSIIEAHEGKMWAEANPEGRGAVFRFTLPIHRRTS